MLGKRIASIRRQKNMSQTQLAQILRVSPSTVGMYEQGRRTPDLNILVRMAETFDVSLDYLVMGKERHHAPLPVAGEFRLLRDAQTGNVVLTLIEK